MIEQRSADTAIPFMADLERRLRNRVQLTSDAHKVYLAAVEQAFRWGRELRHARQALTANVERARARTTGTAPASATGWSGLSCRARRNWT